MSASPPQIASAPIAAQFPPRTEVYLRRVAQGGSGRGPGAARACTAASYARAASERWRQVLEGGAGGGERERQLSIVLWPETTVAQIDLNNFPQPSRIPRHAEPLQHCIEQRCAGICCTNLNLDPVRLESRQI
eukprot:3148506-Rhodomonas_salina.1